MANDIMGMLGLQPFGFLKNAQAIFQGHPPPSSGIGLLAMLMGQKADEIKRKKQQAMLDQQDQQAGPADQVPTLGGLGGLYG
jgi:hypothetical protein